MAWNNIRKISDSAYHNLFDVETPHAIGTEILERHLILEQELTIEDLQGISLKSRNFTKFYENGTVQVVGRYPIKTLGGYVKVNESRTLLVKKQDPALSQNQRKSFQVF